MNTLTLRSLGVAATFAMLAMADVASAQTSTGPAAPQEQPTAQAPQQGRQQQVERRREPRPPP
ncbi:MAG TPA: hypothetical protein VHG93_13580, partial [Longimicrobium sp.]|nr:hypothetical protein [Longimicrobium sp.]